jgi:hypothetical protein
MHNDVVEFVDHLHSRYFRRWQGIELLIEITVEHDAHRKRSQVCSLTRHEHHAKLLVLARLPTGGRAFRGDKLSAAIVSRTLEGRFLIPSGNPSKPLPGGSIFNWVLHMADLIYPTAEFIGIEMTKASNNNR